MIETINYRIHEEIFESEGINQLEIKWVAGKVDFIIHDENTIVLTEKIRNDLSEDENAVFIRSDDKITVDSNNVKSINKIKIFKENEGFEKSLTVALPKNKDLQNLKINTTSADLNIEEICVNTSEISLISGDIKVENVCGENIKISSESGDIETENVKAKYMELKNTSGDIEAENVKAKYMELKNTSGDIKSENINCAQIKVFSTCGDIAFNGKIEKAANITAVSGDIKASFINMPEIMDIKNTSGDILLKIPENDGFEAETKALIGDVFCEFETINERGRISYKTGNSKIHIRTTCGDIKIKKEQ